MSDSIVNLLLGGFGGVIKLTSKRLKQIGSDDLIPGFSAGCHGMRIL